MNKEQLQAKLVKVGMAEKEARIYIAMLEKPEMSAGDLHRIAGVARSKIYDILGKMLAKGFCQERIEKNHRYFKAVQPSILGETLMHRWEA
ncbi:MAG: helix-turn-helix domain-containing protein, partial [Planctomycetota bacterium]